MLKPSRVENEYYKFDEDHQLVVRRQSKETEKYEFLVFSSRTIKQANIPSTIKYIESYSFAQCSLLTSVTIPEDSELISIGKKSFKDTRIKEFYIPSKVEKIEEDWIDVGDQNLCFIRK